MSDPNADFVVLRGGLIEASPDHLTIIDMDILDADDITPETIEEARNLRDHIAGVLEGYDPGAFHDHDYLTSLVAECNSWLNRHATTGICLNCNDDIHRDDNGAGATLWVHDFGSTVCGDNPPGTLTGDNLTVAVPKP
jgi:hypothetical protein